MTISSRRARTSGGHATSPNATHWNRCPPYACAMHPILLLFLVDLIVVAPLTGWLANQKGRSPSGWFVAAIIGGPLAMIAVGLAPSRWAVEEDRRLDGRCPRCDNRVSATARRCSACDAELPQMPRAVPVSTPDGAADQAPTARPTPPAARPQPRSVAEETVAPRVSAPSVRPTVDRSTPPATPEPKVPEPIAARTPEARLDSAPPPVVDEEPGGHDLSQRRGVSNIASGVFAGGVSELGAGYRYLISTSPTMLYISGPIDVAPTKIVFQSPRSTVDASHFEGDLVIVAESPIGRTRQLVFRGIAGADAAKVEELLARPDEPASAPAPEAMPASTPDAAPAAPAAPSRAPRRSRKTTKPTE